MNTSYRNVNPEVRDILERGKYQSAFETLAQQPEKEFEGTVLEGKARKYTILSHKDLNTYIDPITQNEMWVMLDGILGNIENGREKEGKKPFNSYIVINTDESYIDEIVAVLEKNNHWDGVPSNTMKFFELHYPYYSLIMAKNGEEAVRKYIECVAGEDEDFESLLEECEYVPADYAMVRFAQTKGEDSDTISVDEILEQLRGKETSVLITDGSLG